MSHMSDHSNASSRDFSSACSLQDNFINHQDSVREQPDGFVKEPSRIIGSGPIQIPYKPSGTIFSRKQSQKSSKTQEMFSDVKKYFRRNRK